MKLRKVLQVAWEGLTLNKVRSLLTTLGVIIGAVFVIVMLAVSSGAEAAIAAQINSLGANLIIVSPARGTPGASKTFLLDDALAIEKQVIGISGISAEQSPVAQTVKSDTVTLDDIAVIGSTAGFRDVRDYPVASGRYFTSEEDDRGVRLAVLGSGLAANLFGKESPLGQTITVGSTRFTVIGVMKSKGMVGGRGL
jgi:putative ABC transport system permease protein